MKNALLYTLLTCVVPVVLTFEPLSGFYALGAAVTSIGIASYGLVFCRFYECCKERWIVNNITRLELILDKRLYGQHLVKKAVVNHIKGHVTNSSPSKALALSFHGPTGTGKNHVSRIIAEALYRKGMKSDNVKLISATKEFPHHEMVPLYKDRLRDQIESQVKKCPQSLFIFDEIDKMPKGLIDTIKPYLDYHEELGGVNYRHAIYIFLTNAGGTAITEHILQLWRDGIKRKDIGLKEVEKILATAAINSESEGGLWHSGLISQHLITAFLPFLPLEREHIRMCVVDVLKAKKRYSTDQRISEERVDRVMQELSFYPEQEQLYSVTGCKRVAEKVDFVFV